MTAPGAANAPTPTGTVSMVASGASTSAIQSAINGASAGTTLVFPAEAFAITNEVALKTGVSLYGMPGASLVAAYSSGENGFHASGVSNVKINGFVCDGDGGGGGTLNGFFFVDNESDEIRIEWNDFQNNADQSDLFMYNSDNIYFRKNACGAGEFQPVSMHRTEATAHSNIFVTDNTITEYARMAIEALFDVQGEYHVDRNTISGQVVPSASGGGIAVSIVNDNGEGGGGSTQHGTIWGNNISGDTVGIEVVSENMSVEDNVIDTTTGFFIGTCAGSEIENNTITSSNAFQEDGGYDGTEWIGTNTINGSSSTGWSGHGPYGTKPTVNTPSDEPDGGGGDTAPTGTSLLPSRINTTNSGSTVVLHGENLDLTATLTVGGTDVDFTIVSPTEITFTAPDLPAGTYEVIASA